MTLCIVVRTIEGIAIATDTTTTTHGTRTVGGTRRPVTFHTYYRRKLVRVKKWAIVHTGLAFINGKTISQIIETATSNVRSWKKLIDTLQIAIRTELESDTRFLNLPQGKEVLTIGVAGYKGKTSGVHNLTFIRQDDGVGIQTEYHSEKQGITYGISYYGDLEFVRMFVEQAQKRGLLKPIDILTIREALDLARTLLKFLIEFQKFMVLSTVDYPIESAIITRTAGFQWVDQMRFEPLSEN